MGAAGTRDQFGQLVDPPQPVHDRLLAILEDVASPDVAADRSLAAFAADILDLIGCSVSDDDLATDAELVDDTLPIGDDS